MWIARDNNGFLYGYVVMPIKLSSNWVLRSNSFRKKEATVIGGLSYIRLKNDIFPEVIWNDSKPTWKRIILKEWIYVDSSGKTN